MGKVVRLKQERSAEVLLALFLFEKKAEGRSPRTIRDYEEHITAFFRRFPSALSSAGALREAVLAYFAESVKPATFNIRRAYLKAFFSFLLREGVIEENPIRFARRKDEGRARAVPEEALQKLLEVPDKKTFAGLRDYVLFLFILDTGIRPGEALKLRREDFDLQAFEVTVPAEVAKTRKKRTLPLSPVVAREVKRLLSLRPLEWQEAPVFCSSEGEKLSVAAFARRVRRYSREIGYPVTPYDLRHSFAVLFLRNGGNVFALQRTLGHADLTMTKRYLALTQEDLKKEHERATPVARLVKKRVRGV